MHDNSSTTPKLLLRSEEAAGVLAISPRTLWSLTKAGELRCVRIGKKSIRYCVSDLEKYIERRKQDAQQPSGTCVDDN